MPGRRAVQRMPAPDRWSASYMASLRTHFEFATASPPIHGPADAQDAVAPDATPWPYSRSRLMPAEPCRGRASATGLEMKPAPRLTGGEHDVHPATPAQES